MIAGGLHQPGVLPGHHGGNRHQISRDGDRNGTWGFTTWSISVSGRNGPPFGAVLSGASGADATEGSREPTSFSGRRGQ